MKTRFVSIFLITSAILCLILTPSCGSKASYKNDVAVADLTVAVDALLPESGDFVEMSADYILGMMEIDTSEFADYTVKLRASGANIDEYGIFKAPTPDDVAAVKQTVENYLAKRIEAWMPEYMPEEFPKMEAASIKVMGQYVVYGILDENTKSEVFGEVESLLLSK